MRKIIPFFLAFSLVLTSAAYAAPAVDAAGAATLKKQIDDELQWRTDMTKIIGQGLILDGKTEVTPQNGFYNVDLPRLFLATQQGKLDIGHVTLHVAPAPEPNGWLIQQVALPPSMIFYDEKNTPAITVTLGSQHLTGAWRPDQGVYPKLDSLIENIKVSSADKNAPTIKITALKSLVDLKDNGNGTWSGPADFGAAGITIDMPGQKPVSISIGQIASRNVYDRLDMRKTQATKEEARKYLAHSLPQTDQEKKAFLAKFLTQNPVDAEGISSTIELGKFLMHDTATPQEPQREISLDRLSFSGLTPNMKQDKNKLMLKIALDGLHVSFVPPPLSSLVPRTLNAEITFDNVPVGEITSQFFTIVKKQATANVTGTAAQKKVQDEAKAEVADAMAQLPKTLERAGASISIYDTYMKSDSLSTSLESKIDADPKSELGLTGKVTMSIKGLDELVQKIQDAALKPGADPHLLGYLMGFMTVQTKGKPDKAADGVSIRNFDVEMKKNGDVSLNGLVVNPKSAPKP